MQTSVLVAALAAPIAVSSPAPSTSQFASEGAIIAAFVGAWDNADAAALAQLFEPDGRLVIPTGAESIGREAIGAFYSAVFERGYRGSKGSATIGRVTKLTDTVSLVEGEWRITNAKKSDGTPRASESGQFSAVIRSGAGGWRLVVLREMNPSA